MSEVFHYVYKIRQKLWSTLATRTTDLDTSTGNLYIDEGESERKDDEDRERFEEKERERDKEDRRGDATRNTEDGLYSFGASFIHFLVEQINITFQ